MPRLSYRRALTRALADELARDEAVFLLGEDVQVGASLVTTGLAKRFGTDRIRDTPCPSRRSPASPPGRRWPGCGR